VDAALLFNARNRDFALSSRQVAIAFLSARTHVANATWSFCSAISHFAFSIFHCVSGRSLFSKKLIQVAIARAFKNR
jgi:hypothetical protein